MLTVLWALNYFALNCFVGTLAWASAVSGLINIFCCVWIGYEVTPIGQKLKTDIYTVDIYLFGFREFTHKARHNGC